MVNKFSQDLKENVFNSSITYLDRLSGWIERAHIFSADDADILDAFMALEEWSAELYPLLTIQEREEMENLRLTTKKNLIDLQSKGTHLYTLREHFRVFQVYLGVLTQEKGILMKQESFYDPKTDTRI